MRALILNYEYPPLGGGAANAMFHIVREFVTRGGPAVDIVTSASDGKAVTEQLSENVTVHKLAVRKDRIHYWTQKEILDYSRRAGPYMRELLDRRQYDLIHAFFALPCGYIARRNRARVPYIVSLRGSDVPGFNVRLARVEPLLKPVFRRVLRDAAAIQANSEGLRDLALQTAGSAEIEIIYNGVDCERFRPPAQTERDGTLRLISVCRLIERKGVTDLIEALPRIKAALGDIHLTVVGEGNLESELKIQAARLGVAEDIEWLGFVDHDELPQLYNRADIFILPSHYEGMSNSLLEAMAAGLAVVVTDTGGTRELFRRNGRIIAAGSPGSIAEAVIELGSDRAELEACATRSRKTAEEFSWTAVAGRYIETYERVSRARGELKNGRN